jgi:hypothetical protein
MERFPKQVDVTGIVLLCLLLTACAAQQSSQPTTTPEQTASPSPEAAESPTATVAAEGAAPGAEQLSGEIPSESGDSNAERPPSGGQPAEGESGTGASEPTGVLTSGEERGGLDRELDASLKQFDELLEREQEDLAERREETAIQVAASSGGSVPIGTDDGNVSGGGDPTAGSSATGPGSHPSGANRGGSGGVPADVKNGSDDDVVARQLREAAEYEKDPALREKLWQEYRDYKAGLSGKKKKKKTEEVPSDDEGKEASDEKKKDDAGGG